MSRPVVALLHHRPGLPWIFDAADRVGCQLVLVPRPGENVDPAGLPRSVLDVLHLDAVGDPDDALAVLARYRRQRRLDGVITLWEPAVGFTARAAAELGLPGISPEAARRCTDKGEVRRALSAAGANTPAYRTVPIGASADSTGLRFPVVVKPAAGYSSLGVVRVDSAAELADALMQVGELAGKQLPPQACERGLIVEEYISGPEYAVESFLHDGRTYVLSIGYKGEPVGPHFEEGVYRAPAVLPGEVRAAIAGQVAIANRALGVGVGPVHTELRLRDGRAPYVFDIGTRIGGSGVSHFVVAESTGFDLAGNALRAALGQEPVGLTDRPAAHAYAGNYIVQTGGAGVIAEVEGLAGLTAEPSVRHVVQMLFPGDEVRTYPEFSGYPAFVLSVHDSDDALTAFHDRLDRTVRIRYS